MLVESRHVHVRVTGDPQLADAEIDFRTTFAGQPHVVAVRDRIVELDRRPFGRAVLRREKELAADIRNAPDTARRLVLILRDLILRERAGRKGQKREQERALGNR